jgi:cob(I)alamin adenosyltransferase
MSDIIDTNATEVVAESQPEEMSAWIGTTDQYQKILDILSEKLNAIQTALTELSAELAEFVGQFQGVVPVPDPGQEPVQE